MFKVGDLVRLKQDIWEKGEDVPPGVIARKGDLVRIVRVKDDESDWDYAVRHDGNSGSFGVHEEEVSR